MSTGCVPCVQGLWSLCNKGSEYVQGVCSVCARAVFPVCTGCVLCARAVFCVCTGCVLCVHGLCTVCARAVYCVHGLCTVCARAVFCVHGMCSVCARAVYCVHGLCTVCERAVFCVCTGCVLCVHGLCSVYCVCTGCVLCARTLAPVCTGCHRANKWLSKRRSAAVEWSGSVDRSTAKELVKLSSRAAANVQSRKCDCVSEEPFVPASATVAGRVGGGGRGGEGIVSVRLTLSQHRPLAWLAALLIVRCVCVWGGGIIVCRLVD